MKRRDFLKMSSMASLGLSIGGIPVKAFGESTLGNALRKTRNLGNDKIFVIIQMGGGNDGLNTIIPLDRYSELSAARSNVLINQSSVLPLIGNSITGFHPSMTGLQNMYNNGKINFLQGVSYPNPSFSHFRATDIWNTAADSTDYLNEGWVGRFIDEEFPGAPFDYPDANYTDPLAIQIGYSVSSILSGANGLNGLAVSDIDYFYNIQNSTVTPTTGLPIHPANELTYLRYITQQTQAYTAVIQTASQVAYTQVAYPTGNNLADQLKIVAKLIAGGLKTPFYIVNQGGYDTHADQVDDTNHSVGSHATRLGKLSAAIKAFQDDLQQMGKANKVAGCTVSEFGRRIKSNASFGTDHGSAAPLIVFGNGVIPGQIGTSPVLPTVATSNDNVPMQYDFRQVYASILLDWFQLPKSEVKAILNGVDYQTLPIFKSNTGTDNPTATVKEVSLEQNFPNPFKHMTTIRFKSTGAAVQINLFDSYGRKLRTLYENNVPKGVFDVQVERNGLPAGNYFYEMIHGSVRITKQMVAVD
jgi:uncharacterized protein (DUF1501 family)